jgi:undecaprenyl-diphosphatase
VIGGVTGWILSLSATAALAIVFLVPALEASAFVGFLFPGEIAVLLGGVLASAGKVGLLATILAAVLGAIVGDTIGYWVGRRWGHRILRWIARRLHFLEHRTERHLDEARAFLRSRGGTAIVIGRFTAALRVMVPGLAGMSDMHYPTFLAFNAIGGIIWGTTFVLLGYFAGAAWEQVAGFASKAGLALLALVILGLVAFRVLRDVRERGETIPDRLARIRPAAWFRRTFPRVSSWAAGRVDTSTPRGFVLSLAVSVAAFAGWLFGGLTQDVVANEEAVRLDPGILRFAVAHRERWLTEVMRTVTWFGSAVVLVPMLIALAGWLVWRHAGWWSAALIAGPVVGAGISQRIAAALIERPRPPVVDHLVQASAYSFPSGHATQALAGWGAVAIAFAAGRRTPARIWAAIGSTALILAVGVSRIYLGVHWFTDVLAGYALGAVWLCGIGALWCLRSNRGGPIEPTGTGPDEPDTLSLGAPARTGPRR